MNDQRGGKVTIRVFEQDHDDAEFWRSMGLAKGKVKTAAEGGKDEEREGFFHECAP